MSRSYLAFVVAGAGVGGTIFLWALRQAGLPGGWRAVGLATATATSGLVGARLYAMAEQGWRWELTGGLDGGFRMPGAVAGLLLGLVVWRRVLVPEVPFGLIGDLGVIATQFGAVVARLGCLAAGCCFGSVCDLPWAVRFPRGTAVADVHAAMGWIDHGAATSLPVHPLQLYFLLLHLTLGLFLLWLARRKAYDGQVLLVGLLIGQSGKALLESLREPLAGGGHLQLVAVAFAAAAAAALIGIARRRRGRRTRVAAQPRSRFDAARNG